MCQVELLKYVAAQLLVLAVSLNEDLTKSGAAVLPLTSVPPVTPNNIGELLADSVKRIGSLTVSPSSVQPVAELPPPVAQPSTPVVAPKVVAAAPPAAPAHAPPSLPRAAGRRKRDVTDAIGDVAGLVADAASVVSDKVEDVAPCVAVAADAIDASASMVASNLKDEPAMIAVAV